MKSAWLASSKQLGRDLHPCHQQNSEVAVMETGGGNGGGGGNGEPQLSTSRAPKPVIRRAKKRKQTAPVKRLTIEQKIRKEQRKTKVQFSKAYFAK